MSSSPSKDTPHHSIPVGIIGTCFPLLADDFSVLCSVDQKRLWKTLPFLEICNARPWPERCDGSEHRASRQQDSAETGIPRSSLQSWGPLKPEAHSSPGCTCTCKFSFCSSGAGLRGDGSHQLSGGAGAAVGDHTMPSMTRCPRGLGTPGSALAPTLTLQFPPGLWCRAPSETLLFFLWPLSTPNAVFPLPLCPPGFISCWNIMTGRSAAWSGYPDVVIRPLLSLPQSLRSFERTKA